VAEVGAGERPKRVDRNIAAPPALRSASLLIIALLAIVYTLYFGKELLLPITLALLFKLLLQAPMRFLTRRLRLPDPVAALVMILTVFGCIALVALTVSVPASGWVGESARKPGRPGGEARGPAPPARGPAERAARPGGRDQAR
jgi:hypothetical protein